MASTGQAVSWLNLLNPEAAGPGGTATGPVRAALVTGFSSAVLVSLI
jgi:hypothetical protein